MEEIIPDGALKKERAKPTSPRKRENDFATPTI